MRYLILLLPLFVGCTSSYEVHEREQWQKQILPSLWACEHFSYGNLSGEDLGVFATKEQANEFCQKMRGK